MEVGRRRFIAGALGASGALVAGTQWRGGLPARAAAAPAALPEPHKSGIEHIVVVMMENRSFDHLLGWLPNANGRQAGLSFRDHKGATHATYHATAPSGCGFDDPDHSYEGGRVQHANGAMNGFLSGSNDLFPISYYEEADRPFTSSLARAFTTCDNYFCSILGPTYPNRFFLHAAQTDRLTNTSTTSTIPTIWDQLNRSGGPTGRYYFNDLPILALWGTKYLTTAAPYAEFLLAAASGTLPNVSYVDPRFEDEGSGISNDDHPRADIRAGDALLSQIFHAVSSGPAWSKTVLVIVYDEWGGFYDHVAPPRVTAAVPIGASPASGVDKDLVGGKTLLGFRVPCLVASPFSRGSSTHPRVQHGLYDHTSVLKMIEWRWGLHPLTARDHSTHPSDPGNLAAALDFRPQNKPVIVPKLPHLVAPPDLPCQLPGAVRTGVDHTWSGLQKSGLLAGWPL